MQNLKRQRQSRRRRLSPLLWLRYLRFRRRRSGTRLTRMGWYCAAIVLFTFFVAVTRQMNLLFGVSCTLGSLLLCNWLYAGRMINRVSVRRRVARNHYTGDLITVFLEVANQREKRSVWALRITDCIRPVLPKFSTTPVRPTVGLVRVPCLQTVLTRYQGRLFHRGLYRLGPLQLSSSFPFGLIERWRTLPLEDELLIYPRLSRLKGRWLSEQQCQFEGAHHRQYRTQRIGNEFYGVRQWQHGDSPRWIHWRSSAKHGMLVVRQFECPRNRDTLIALELCHHNSKDEEAVELAVSLAATTIVELCRRGGAELAVSIGGRNPVTLHGPASPSLMENALEALAVAEPTRSRHWNQLLWDGSKHIGRTTQLILLSSSQFSHEETASIHMQVGQAGLTKATTISTANGDWRQYFEP